MSTTLPYHEICRVNEQETKLWQIFRTSLPLHQRTSNTLIVAIVGTHVFQHERKTERKSVRACDATHAGRNSRDSSSTLAWLAG